VERGGGAVGRPAPFAFPFPYGTRVSPRMEHGSPAEGGWIPQVRGKTGYDRFGQPAMWEGPRHAPGSAEFRDSRPGSVMGGHASTGAPAPGPSPGPVDRRRGRPLRGLRHAQRAGRRAPAGGAARRGDRLGGVAVAAAAPRGPPAPTISDGGAVRRAGTCAPGRHPGRGHDTLPGAVPPPGRSRLRGTPRERNHLREPADRNNPREPHASGTTRAERHATAETTPARSATRPSPARPSAWCAPR
jgi:hypothetical protein